MTPGYSQGGSNVDSLLADSYVKGIRAGINWTEGLEAMLTDATVSPKAWNYGGRGSLDSRKKLGYLAVDDYSSQHRALSDSNRQESRQSKGVTATLHNVWGGYTASRLLEYCFNDAGIALVAAGEDQLDIYHHYKNRSGDWKNIWNADLESEGWKGFAQGRYANGQWSGQDPTMCSPLKGFTRPCYLSPAGADGYEGSLHQCECLVLLNWMVSDSPKNFRLFLRAT